MFPRGTISLTHYTQRTSKMNIKCKYDDLVSPKTLKPHPKNRNKHPVEQIDRLAKLIEYQGVRAPIVVSKLSGCIVKGHGTLMALKKLKLKEIPVVYQDFDNEDQEYAFIQSDNAIGSWAELDLSGINADVGDLAPSFDIDWLGIKDFMIEPADKEIKNTNEELDIKNFDNFQHQCPKCGFEWNDDGTT